MLITVLAVHCGTAAPRGGVRVITNVPQATLYVDDELRGPVDAYEDHYLHLAPGQHKLMIEHAEYFTEHIDVTVVEDITIAVTLRMRRQPQKSSGDR